ncbi:MAG: uracil phosphoribosyltransferase [Flavobacteriales bacterium]|nr:uracil phosphoribosyltransferase [Flavobacteriales bacterium]
MKIRNLSQTDSIVQEILRELRDVSIQTDRYRFRKNIERMGTIAAYEISKELEYVSRPTKTPLGEATTRALKEQPVIATVLRAGLPLQSGVNQLFNQADLAYISAYRKHSTPTAFEVVVEYLACPSLTDRVLILTDPMLATGQSLVLTYQQFLRHGKPSKVHLVSVIGSEQGVSFVQEHIPEATLWIGTIDPILNEAGYIVPGLGDAGDLSFGMKE